MMKKIAVLGTCASENWYHYRSPRQRLEVELAPPYQPSALVSLWSEPVEFPAGITNLNIREVARLRADFEKTYLQDLKNVQPDYLIVDLLLDSRRGVIEIGNGRITNSYIIQRSSLAHTIDFTKGFNHVQEPQKYLEEFATSIKHLGAYLRSNVPGCRIILHKARWAEYFIDKNGDLQPFEPKRQVSHFVANLFIRKLEEVFENEIACDVISMENVPTIADVQHILGFLPLHYEKSYYYEFLRKLRLILEG